jgi:heme-degrading monooxygenase HmoA
MVFIQTLSFSTSRYDEMQTMMDEFSEQQREGGPAPGFRGLKILKDRERDGAYMLVVEFDSYELAMENSARPETDAFAKRMAAMTDGPPSFGNYDVVHEETP